MSRRKRPNLTTPAPPRMTIAEANDLAAELILDLTPHAGNPRAVGKILDLWLDHEDDVFRLSLVCMAALKQTYADRLTRVPLDYLEPDDLTLTPKGTTHD